MLMIHLMLDLPFVNELDTATEMNRQIGVGGVEKFLYELYWRFM